MRRVIVTALVLITTSWGFVGGQGHRILRLDDSRPIASRSANRGPCDEVRWMRISPESWSERKVKGLIRCAVRRWPVPGGAAKAIAVAECESSLWPWAVGGDNLGLYQHRSTFWFDRVHRFLRERWFNRHQWERLTTRLSGAFIARANVLVSIRMAHVSGWGAWSCA